MSTRLILQLTMISLMIMPQFTIAQQSDQSVKTHGASARDIEMRGCISGGREAFTFMQIGTGAAFRLRKDARTLEPYRGKLVDLKGTEFAPKAAHGLKDLPELGVKSVQVIAAQCPFAVEGKGGSPAGQPITIPPTSTPSQNSSQRGAGTPRYQPPGAPNQTPPRVSNKGSVTGAPSPGTGNPPK